jgi:hypothetical protein
MFSNYLRLHNWINNYSWTASSSADAIIATIPVHPQYCNIVGPSPFVVNLTPCAFAGMSCAQWRGSLIYVVQVFCPKGVTGSLRFTHHPQVPGLTPALDPVSIGQCVSTVVAVDGDTTTSIAVPFSSVYPLLDTVDVFQESSFALNTVSAGSLEISVAGALVNLYGLSVDVNINVWMIPGPDFEYFVPKRQPVFDPPSVSIVRQSSTTKTVATGTRDPNMRPDLGHPCAMIDSNLVHARDVFYSPVTSWYDLLTYPIQFDATDLERNIYDLVRANSNVDAAVPVVGGLWEFPFVYMRGNWRIFGAPSNVSLGHLSGNPAAPTFDPYRYSIPNFNSMSGSCVYEIPHGSRFPYTWTDYTNPFNDRFFEFSGSTVINQPVAFSDNMQFFWPKMIQPALYTPPGDVSEKKSLKAFVSKKNLPADSLPGKPSQATELRRAFLRGPETPSE